MRFQSTFPRGERLIGSNGFCNDCRFQSTFPRGERPLKQPFPFALLYFNPRSHEGNDAVANMRSLLPFISIHVPTRGTTVSRFSFNDKLKHFNPRSHEGNDKKLIRKNIVLRDFNPRSHEGNDFLPLSSHAHFPLISIHVPTRGTTILTNRLGV